MHIFLPWKILLLYQQARFSYADMLFLLGLNLVHAL